MGISGNKDVYKKYSKSEKRFHWGFVIVSICIALLSLAWKPYILPFLQMLRQ